MIAKVLACLLMLVYFLLGIRHMASPMAIWRWQKRRGEMQGLAMQDSPSPETVERIRLKGCLMITLSVAFAIALAIAL